MRVINKIKQLKIDCEILPVLKEFIPKKKDGWSFNWLKAYRDDPNSIFGLFEKHSKRLHGVIQLTQDEGMLIMQLIELAPFNIGVEREHSNVTGCLIAYACRESLKLETPYRGYLTFVSKSSLVEFYKAKYLATQTLGTRMYIDPKSGEKLIKTYLEV